MSNTRLKYFDTHTLYVTSGVAREEQLYIALRIAIKNGEERLYNEDLEDFIFDLDESDLLKSLGSWETLMEKNNLIVSKLIELDRTPPEKTSLECRIRVNLIVNKNGDYYGFGYIHVSKEEVYWMLLGKNPDGTDRVLEYLDPEWLPPLPKPKLTEEEEQERYSNMKWYEIAEEEDKYVHPVIKQVLKPLMTVPGYKYDEMQYKHLQEIALEKEKDPTKVPEMGYFELSRAYARDVELGKMTNVLCARQVPEWIPSIAFKSIFKGYASDPTTKILQKKSTDQRKQQGEGDGDAGRVPEDVYDSYPFVSLIEGKKDGGKIVFVTFEPDTRDAIFALLMTRKVHIVHPRNSKLRCTLIFDHAYEKGRTHGSGTNSRYNENRPTGRRYNDKYNENRPNDGRRYNDKYNENRPTGRRYNDNRPTGRRYNDNRPNNDRRYNDNRSRYPSRSGYGPGPGPARRFSSKPNPQPRDDVDISKYNYTKRSVKTQQ